MLTFPEKNAKIAIVGLGYVGIPLLIEILKTSSNRTVIGFDIDENKINLLSNSQSLTEFGYEKSLDFYVENNHLILTSAPLKLQDTRIYIATVPTPINECNTPDLTALKHASQSIGESIYNSNIADDDAISIIYESTVFPGATEEVCLPIIQKYAKDKSKNIRIGYSPERINPGDSQNKLVSIKKVTSGEDSETAEWVDSFYKDFIQAGTCKVASIKIAEASKVIENTQRDLNIALANELAMICSRLDIDTNDVLDAACTKWNFMNIRPGLVGGHCIGVDPYYLAHKAESLGVHPQVILSGRQVNDGMPGWIARRAVKQTISLKGAGSSIKCLILGLTFKENCDDTRNSKSIELYNCLQSYGVETVLTDPLLDQTTAEDLKNFNFIGNFLKWEKACKMKYDLIILSVCHDFYKNLEEEDFLSLGNLNTMYYDLKNCLPRTLPNLYRL